MLLVSEKVDFRISTTDLEAIYTESNGVKLRIDVQKIDDFKNDTYREVELHFLTVAELKCITLNFFDFNYDNFKIQDEVDDTINHWQENGVNPNPHFYQIINSDILKSRRIIYDPKNRLNLKHYLIIGCDSYVEVIASKYEIKYI
ncbi:hypothetical protein EXT68_22640 [Pectobacterium parmentieri]|uniref:Uncharacterized protein n=1 Tax=Pectobacterium parmentieri TaxID=1905730 RepID=A0A0H3HY93_PECPM|nr:hypothetical protein [Pectobacterium parmentieri]AFI88284.1 Hypothetical protein W5S_0145 [Pectobacterium parmentieri]MBI0473386.1 hypothetical protein [Pectobacterium parmentieri]MBI0496011.1 hypothetical protein [Pectobacterium parmentieri]MBI0557415.1 hypothetical protein [Pectobacterium parmentieri]MBI0570553.1 hypothetical protein [Pectobacterium parmentieri]